MVEITLERYDELIRAEQVANQLKLLIDTKYHKYGTIEREEIRILHQMCCEVEENEGIS